MARPGRCSLCSEWTMVRRSMRTGKDVCTPCYKRHHQPKRKCVACGTVTIAKHNDDDGNPVCAACYVKQYQLVPCAACGELRRPAFRLGTLPFCQTCYAHAFPHRERCATCGKMKKIASRNADGSAICPACYERELIPLRICSQCGKERRTRYRTAAGGPLCSRCYTRARLSDR